MSRRKRDRSGSIFDQSDTPSADLNAITDGIFGADLRQHEQRQVRATPLPIDAIYPDPQQPRRALPTPIRAAWDGQPAHLPDAFIAWIDAVNIEREKAGILDQFDLKSRLEAQDDTDDSLPVGALENALLAVIRLAIAIERDGLTNPITVAPYGADYVVETGERRWLAYHLLRWQYGDDWSQIPARQMPQKDIWRQATENNARDDLNAIARARQFALLLMDVLRQDGEEFRRGKCHKKTSGGRRPKTTPATI